MLFSSTRPHRALLFVCAHNGFDFNWIWLLCISVIGIHWRRSASPMTMSSPIFLSIRWPVRQGGTSYAPALRCVCGSARADNCGWCVNGGRVCGWCMRVFHASGAFGVFGDYDKCSQAENETAEFRRHPNQARCMHFHVYILLSLIAELPLKCPSISIRYSWRSENFVRVLYFCHSYLLVILQ